MSEEIIDDSERSGISIGLECKYRMIKHGENYVIYEAVGGRIVERIESQRCDIADFEAGLERLYKINGLERTLSGEVREAIDGSE